MGRDWLWQGEVVRWIDGDTVEIDVDLGFHTSQLVRFRLLGIDTPEIRGKERPEGLVSAARSRELAPKGSVVWVRSAKHGKFNWLGEIWPLGSVPDMMNATVNDILIAEGLADPYFGGKKKK